jgi:hypothetical protein
MRVSQASFLLSTCLTEERVTDALLGFNQLWTQFAESCKDVNCNSATGLRELHLAW